MPGAAELAGSRLHRSWDTPRLPRGSSNAGGCISSGAHKVGTRDCDPVGKTWTYTDDANGNRSGKSDPWL